MSTMTRNATSTHRPSARAFALLLLAPVLGALAAAEARADIEVHVVNCTRAGLHAKAYDAKDMAETIPASEKEFSEGQPGEAHLLRCAGEGKGFCQLVLKGTGDSGVREQECPYTARQDWSWREYKLEKDHHLFVVGFQLDPDESGSCRPSLIDSAHAERCDDPSVLGKEFSPE